MALSQGACVASRGQLLAPGRTTLRRARCGRTALLSPEVTDQPDRRVWTLRSLRLAAVWRAWEVFGEANRVTDEVALLERLGRLARRPVSIADSIGCIAVSECVFLDPDDWIELPASFRPQNLSGSALDLDKGEGQALWTQCLERAASGAVEWTAEALDRERAGQPQIVIPRLGQGSFRLAVVDAYGGGCAITSEHSMPALEAAHIRPWALGGQHEVSNGLPLRRDIHRLFDPGYMSARPDGRVLVSPRLKSEFANGHT